MRLALVLPFVLAAGAAAAQGYPSALPLDGDEKRAVEARLSTILDHAGTNEVSRFTLPTGRRVAVRTYPRATGRNGVPCRGYRMDLEGADGMVAVDGFRCRAVGRAWIITEPETVVARSEAPRDLAVARAERRPTVDDLISGDDPFGRRQPGGDAIPRGEVPLGTPPQDLAAPLSGAPRDLGAPRDFGAPSPDDLRDGDDVLALPGTLDGPGGFVGADEGRAAHEALIGDEPFAPPAPPPLPRRAPSRIAAAEPPAAEEPSASVATDAGPRQPLQGLVAEALDRTGEASDEPPARSDAAATRVAAVDPGAARVVDTRPAERTAPPAGFAADRRVVDGLRELQYLRGAGSFSDRAVRDAVDEFARDEQFALPISTDDLAERLAAAAERSVLPDCAGDPAAVCLSGD